jgi:hypothetical protein
MLAPQRANSSTAHRCFFDIARGIVEQWPQPSDSIRGRSLADVLNSTLAQASLPPSNRGVLRDLIRKVAGAGGMGIIHRLSVEPIDAPTPIPGLNRRSIVLRALGNKPLLHAGQVPSRRKVRPGESVAERKSGLKIVPVNASGRR